MICTFCQLDELRQGTVTVTLERGRSTIIIKDVPAEVCDKCGEYVLSQPVTNWIWERAQSAVERGAEVEILRYAA
jgi:YgiT-type zinc finger domain-containing protein